MAGGTIEELINNYPDEGPEQTPIENPSGIEEIIEPNTPEPEPVEEYEPQSLEDYIVQDEIENNPDYVPPVEYFNPYTEQAPKSVLEAQDQFNQVNVATQDYADEMVARIIADHNGYMTNEDYQGMMNRTLTDQAYNYVKRANNGADESAWGKPNPEDELFTKYLPEIIQEQELRRQAAENMQKKTPTEEERMVQSVYNRSNAAQQAVIDAGSMEHGSW